MTSKGIPKELWETYRAMSVDVGRLIEFLKDTACMNPQERQIIALCKTAERMIDDKDFSEVINEIAIPYLEYMGRAKWKRDVVSDLGFAMAGKHSKSENVSGILEYQPES